MESQQLHQNPHSLQIPKSSRRTFSTFNIPNIIALLKMESQQLSQNSPTLQFT